MNNIFCRGLKIGYYEVYGRDTWKVHFDNKPQSDYTYIIEPKNSKKYTVPNANDLRLMMCHLYEEAAPPTIKGKSMSNSGLSLFNKYGYILRLDQPFEPEDM